MYEFAKYIAIPPASLILLAGIALLIRVWARRTGMTLLVFSVLSLYLFSTPAVGTWLMTTLEQESPAVGHAPVEFAAQAIVVLGGDVSRNAPEYGGITLGPRTLERVRFAANLYHRTRIPVLVTGGVIGGTSYTLAHLMREVLSQEFDTPVRWAEDRAGNTLENATYSAHMLRKEGIDTVYLVTHASHMPRASEAFEWAGLHVLPAATGFTSVGPPGVRFVLPEMKALRMSHFALYEIIGRIVYEVLYYRQQPSVERALLPY